VLGTGEIFSFTELPDRGGNCKHFLALEMLEGATFFKPLMSILSVNKLLIISMFSGSEFVRTTSYYCFKCSTEI
jgi:hypothetical protein